MPALTGPLTAEEVLDREFLEIRAKILEVAAALDRLDRASGSVAADERRRQIDAAIAILHTSNPDRSERVQRQFSLPYLEHWREQFQIDTRRERQA